MPSKRCVLLVDAGYVHAAAGALALGTTSRSETRLRSAPLIEALVRHAQEGLSADVLRLYWYDAARDRVPTVEQRQIASLDRVKLRLGNLNRQGVQKGVDALIRSDLVGLSQHRAVDAAVLLTGDEDMLPALEDAQAYGVIVHLWGIEPPYGINQAERLRWEADTVHELDRDFVDPFVETAAPSMPPAAGPAPLAVPAVPTAGTTAGTVPTAGEPEPARPSPVVLARRTPVSVATRPTVPLGPERERMLQIGEHIAHRWLLVRGKDNLADLLPGPILPTVIDHELLVEGERELGASLRPWREARDALREGFWERLYREFDISVGSAS